MSEVPLQLPGSARGRRASQVHCTSHLQRYLAHESPPPLRDHHRVLGITLLQGFQRGGLFV